VTAVSVALSVQHSIGGACKLSGVDTHSVAKHDVDMMGSYFHRWVHTARTPSPPNVDDEHHVQHGNGWDGAPSVRHS